MVLGKSVNRSGYMKQSYLRYCMLLLLCVFGLPRAESVINVDAVALLQTHEGNEAKILQQLLNAKPSPLIGIELNRSYGETLDQLLSQRKISWSIYTRTTSSKETGSMLPMLQRGFIDATLEYRKMALRTDPTLRFYPLLEAQPVNLVHFACSKGERGQRIVNLLNQTIATKSQQADYQQLVLQGIAEPNRALVLQTWLRALTSVP